jgi:hypothetical protein
VTARQFRRENTGLPSEARLITFSAMWGIRVFAAFCAALIMLSTSPAFAELTPDQTVTKYLEAMQGQKFDEAYNYVSSGLRGGKNREDWSKEQQYIVQMGEVKIFGFKVFKPVVEGDKAKVPNILKSQDKFLNQLGLDEYELYELIREEGTWRIDQQTLVEDAERSEYFPEK